MSILPSRIVRPAAISCPPNFSRDSEQRFNASTKFKPSMLRPLPFPIPFSSNPITIAGRWYLREIREATIPRTPGCQPRALTTIAASRAGSKSRTICSSAARKISFSTSCRSRFCLSSNSASDAASASSCVSKSCSDLCALLSRPEALSRGPRRKPMCSVKIGGRTPLTSINLFKPGRVDLAISSAPRWTKVRFSPRNGTISATVPNATRSSLDLRSNPSSCLVFNSA